MTASEYLSEFIGVNIITKSSMSVKAEITWDVLNGDVIYIVDPSTLARRLPIKNVINPLISEQINAHYTFSFDTVFDDKTKYINNANIIEVDDDYFQVVRIVKKRETSVSMSVSCEHVSYVLLDSRKYPMPFKDIENTPRNIMSALLRNTGFTIGTVEIDGSFYIKPNSDNIRGTLIELANLVGGELVWNKFTVSLVNQRGQNKGLEFKLGENLIGVTEEIDTTGDVPRRALEVDVLDLARLSGYEYLKTVELGDTVRVFDYFLDIDETLRIVSRDYNPFQKVNPRVSIGNIIRDISDYVKDIESLYDDRQDSFFTEAGIGNINDEVIFIFEKQYDTVLSVTTGLVGNSINDNITLLVDYIKEDDKISGVKVAPIGVNTTEAELQVSIQAICQII